jgi:hypothetical protein
MANISNLLPKPVAVPKTSTGMLYSSPAMQKIASSYSINPDIPSPSTLGQSSTVLPPQGTPGIVKSPIKTVANTPGATGGNATSTPINTNVPPPVTSITAGNQQNTPGGSSNIIPTPDRNSYQGLVSRVAGAGTPNNTQNSLIQRLQDTAAGNTQIGADARAIADRYSNEINRVGGLGAGAVAGSMGTGTSVVGAGNAAIASQSASARMNALGQAENAALLGTGQQLTGQGQMASAYNNALTGANTQQGQNISALGTAAGLAQPIQVPYSNQLVNPQTGETMGGNSESLQIAVQTIQQKLQRGEMSYDDAKAALVGYGQGGLNALNKSLPPGFNIAQSNTNAQQQGAIGPAISYANTAIQNVKNIMAQLPDTQNTNIPILNAITRGFSTVTGVGSEQTRALTGAIQSLKNAYAALLASTKGGTPTDYSSQADAEIPDNPTMNDITAVEKNMQTLGQARQQIYGNPGMSGVTGNNNIPEGSVHWEHLLD